MRVLQDKNGKTYLVLIDTWWNVNTDKSEFYRGRLLVLIDTWWNVNTICTKCNGSHAHVLIDTWWNVNACAQAVRFLGA